ncbi:P-loop containing nucleoside triphosphate hydrolase protein [Dunaliella salina]|uniref:Kinesin-like protein n=1 Tax=Dunaliella salina TaxID=3046 RepID=A0ABQ7GY40_DUNSA|nr:P-loop containing nucleoside triphosphate hydrolase protein [Dunaliella salina]|eukprot:KAF5839516.1 P-loop containing nucleoside triphosphate hydrolase protein [Dunaliella salina]
MVSCESKASAEEQAQQSSTVQTLVRVRVRPLNSKEKGKSCLELIDQQDSCSNRGGSVAFLGTLGTAANYDFDRVYGELCSQAHIFKDLAFVVDAALAGYNGTVLAYGQTGSGKTHTLFGSIEDQEHAGIVPRAVQHLGRGIAKATIDQGAVFKVTLSVVEIYCERIRCLLSNGSPGKDNLQVKTDKLRGVYVEGESQMGGTTRNKMMNEASSRSHCVVTIMVERSSCNGEATLGKLVLVDLAGSERAGKTGAAGTQLAEGALINKSLSSLANVINALTDSAGSSAAPNAAAAARHVPFRDSKLTRVLQDSLGGTARTVLICCCSPAAENAQETLSTLRFGARAKGVTCKLQVNQQLSANRLQQLLAAERAQREALASELELLKASASLIEAGGAQLSFDLTLLKLSTLGVSDTPFAEKFRRFALASMARDSFKFFLTETPHFSSLYILSTPLHHGKSLPCPCKCRCF